MAHAWLTEARRIQPATDGGPLRGGAPRAVWLTVSGTQHTASAQSAAQRLVSEQRPCHLVWDPATGEIVQLVSALRAARALGSGIATDAADVTGAAGVTGAADMTGAADVTGAAGAAVRAEMAGHVRCADANTEGRICMQIGVLGHPSEPFTDGPLTGLAAIVSWLDSWGVQRRWPAGAPADHASVPGPPNGCERSRALWSRGGHFGASQVPGCAQAPGHENTGPGAIDIGRLTGPQLHEVHALSPLPISA